MEQLLPVMLLKGLILLPNQEVKIELSNNISKEIIKLASKKYNRKVLVITPHNQIEESPEVQDLPDVGVIGKIKSKIDRLNELYIDGRINKEKYENDYLKYQDLIKNSQNKIKKHNYSHLNKLLNKDVIKTYNGLNNIEKRAFWGEFIDKIEISKEHFDIYFKAFDN